MLAAQEIVKYVLGIPTFPDSGLGYSGLSEPYLDILRTRWNPTDDVAVLFTAMAGSIGQYASFRGVERGLRWVYRKITNTPDEKLDNCVNEIMKRDSV